ncbi:hypothetical protein E0W68_08970 [Flavobacterium salilacus subsp. salilacus]|uniref:hypothetical protein n=1 Tax=Flavobacterium TaxID=237 RepID=UPI001074C2FC|nr:MULTISPECIES: hypothetical protein [Flavobacterium]KAF2518448.1 hypothetical protein E0W68_08970 [Flavobacterium salilacus subsp. salilacus]MBE1615086.1 hypothetical protein [Flavobacterium sp. SaA2.13]
MSNTKRIIGIAAGVAALTTAGILIYRRNAKKTAFRAQVEEAKDAMKGKLNSLQRKAEKEIKNTTEETKTAVNTAKERANEWTKAANA